MNALTTIPEIALTEMDGVPRARDIEIAERLGYSQSRDIRKLIERNREELEQFGALARHRGAPIKSGKGRLIEVEEYWLNEEQALLSATLSEAQNAAAVRAMLIRVFVAWRRGHLAPAKPAANGLPDSREARLQFRLGITIGKMAGYKGNELLLSAAKIAKAATGFDYLGTIGATALPAPTDNAMLSPSALGERLGGMSGKAVNVALSEYGYHEMFRDHAGRPYYEPTEKGRLAGGRLMDTGKRHSNGTPVSQLKWPSSVADELSTLLKVDA